MGSTESLRAPNLIPKSPAPYAQPLRGLRGMFSGFSTPNAQWQQRDADTLTRTYAVTPNLSRLGPKPLQSRGYRVLRSIHPVVPVRRIAALPDGVLPA